jgi:hypothetical protein
MLSRPHTLAFLASLAAAATGIGASQLGCEHDLVLANKVTPAMCGNGIVEQGEACDNNSPGCVGCIVAPEWTCPDNVCSVTCNDPGVVQTGLNCARMASCNMEGYWAVRETDYTQPPMVAASMSTQWYLYHLTQPGSASRYKIDTALDCGVHVTGAATVDYTPNTEEYLMYRSGIDEGPHGPRQGDAEPIAGGCKVTLDRYFFVRGATNAYLPTDFDNDASLPPKASLPWLDAPALPAQPPGAVLANDTHFPPGAVNTNGDAGVAYPGGAFQISGQVNGIRHSAQRDYKGYAATSPIARTSLSFSFPGNYSLQESVLSVTDCANPLVCALLETAAYPSLVLTPSVTFSFIGTDLKSPRTSSVIVGTPKKSGYASDLATCDNIRLILPHDGSIHDGSASADASAP